MNRIASLPNEAKLNVAGLVLTAIGMLLEIAAGSELYPTLTGPVVLLIGAALVAFRLGRWTSYIGLIIPLVLAVGLTISAVMSPAFPEQLVDVGNAGIVVGSVLHIAGLIAAITGGVGIGISFPAISGGRMAVAAAVVLVGVIGLVAPQLWDPSAIRGSFDVGGRSLYLECVGEGSPTIVMESGSGGDHTTWAPVVAGVRGSNRTCTYDRANTGSSDAVSGDRTSSDVAADLHRLLGMANIAPPYILVAHSLGGISMRLFASTYADEVEALILVDATPTTFVEDACAIVDADQCEIFRSDFEPANNGGIDIAGSAAEIAAAAPLRAMPVVVMVANDHGHDGFVPGVQFEAMWLERQQAVADSVEGGQLHEVASGHNIQSLYPELVISAISTVAAELAAATP